MPYFTTRPCYRIPSDTTSVAAHFIPEIISDATRDDHDYLKIHAVLAATHHFKTAHEMGCPTPHTRARNLNLERYKCEPTIHTPRRCQPAGSMDVSRNWCQTPHAPSLSTTAAERCAGRR